MSFIYIQNILFRIAAFAIVFNIVNANAANDIGMASARLNGDASTAIILDATRAGNRIVAVGEQGYVFLSDDGGKTHRQAKSVPVNTTLTAVTFIDEKNGWACGHGGAIIHTDDGGETWLLQNVDANVDQPLFTVYFRDSQIGWAAGLWASMLATVDGGKSWSKVILPAPEGQKRSDFNLLKFFPDSRGYVYVAAEQGMVLRSKDGGSSWEYIKTGTNASLWAGVATGKNTLLVAGLRGKILRSVDGGINWVQVSSGLDGSVTQLQVDGSVTWASSIDGRLIRSEDDGQTWKEVLSVHRALTAMALRLDHSYVLYSKQGVMK